MVVLFDHALRGKWVHVPATSVGHETSWAKQGGGNGKRKEVPGERPGADRSTFT